MTLPHSYNINLRWTTDRQGKLEAPSLTESLHVATPLPFAGGVDHLWSPEHLFTASVSSCLMTTFLAIAANSKLTFEKFSCEASGKLDQVDGRYLMTEIHLKPIVVISREEDATKTERLLQKAEAACLISNSIKATVHMQPRIEVLKPA